MAAFSFTPVPHEEARERIAKLPLVSREVMDGMLPELRAYAFTITGLDVGDQMAKARDLIAAVPAGEKTWDKARKEIAAELVDDLGGKAAERRAELLLRTHVFRGYAAARYRKLMAQVKIFPFWQYKTHGDGNVRPSHAALNGKIFPAGHEIWQRIFPPWDWGCRCLVVPLTKRSAEAAVAAGKPSDQAAQDGNLLPTQIATPEMFTDKEAALIDKHQRLPNGVPLNRTPTWADAPWSVPGTVQHDWRLIEKRYADQPEALEAFREWADKTEVTKGVTVSTWIGEGRTVFEQPLYRDPAGYQVELTEEEDAAVRRIMTDDTGELRLGAPMQPLAAVMARPDLVEQFEKEVMHDSRENGATWSLDGQEKERVRSASEDEVVMQNRFLHGAVFSHNHPKAGPPSPKDVTSLFDSGMAELRVATSTHLHRLRAGKKAMPALKLTDIPGFAFAQSAADAVAANIGGPEHFRQSNAARFLLDWLARRDYLSYERIPHSKPKP